MKKRIFVYLFACLLVGVLFSAVASLIPDHRFSPIHVRVYPNVDVDQTITQINALHLTGVIADRVEEANHGWAWFCMGTFWITFIAIIGTAFVLVIYATLCRVFKISLKK